MHFRDLSSAFLQDFCGDALFFCEGVLFLLGCAFFCGDMPFFVAKDDKK